MVKFSRSKWIIAALVLMCGLMPVAEASAVVFSAPSCPMMQQMAAKHSCCRPQACDCSIQEQKPETAAITSVQNPGFKLESASYVASDSRVMLSQNNKIVETQETPPPKKSLFKRNSNLRL